MTAPLVLAALLLHPPPATTVYYGALKDARKPGEVEAGKIFREIPEYRSIQDKGLDSRDPEYFVLLSKANAKFFAAVRRAAAGAGCDVVVERGSASFAERPADLTSRAIEALEK